MEEKGGIYRTGFAIGSIKKIMKKTLRLIMIGVIITVMLFSLGCGRRNYVARVNEQEITRTQMEERKSLIWLLHGVRVEDPADEEQVVEELINEQVLLQAANRENIEFNEEDKQEVVDDVKEYLTNYRFSSEEEFNRALQNEKLTMEHLEQVAENQLRIDGLYQQIIEVATLTEEDRPYYDEQIRARHILVSTEQEAQELLARIQAGEDFAVLAEEYSMDQGSAVNGGDLGFFGRTMMVYPFEQAAYALEVGQVSEPVKTQFGYHLIKLEERKMSGASDEALLEMKKLDLRMNKILIWEKEKATIERNV